MGVSTRIRLNFPDSREFPALLYEYCLKRDHDRGVSSSQVSYSNEDLYESIPRSALRELFIKAYKISYFGLTRFS